jgi:hypothetical protein
MNQMHPSCAFFTKNPQILLKGRYCALSWALLLRLNIGHGSTLFSQVLVSYIYQSVVFYLLHVCSRSTESMLEQVQYAYKK